MKMKVALLFSLIAAAAAKTVIWNGRSAAFDDSVNWQGARASTFSRIRWTCMRIALIVENDP
jgi:hypothetical protein